ncbi:MAG TPA: hypothetical protein VK003_10305 [Oceanobacillus sp.]|nr:hypothetical protein [Oceanobacillus sp.]
MNGRYEVTKTQSTTEASQNAPAQHQDEQQPRSFDSDAQQPTHDALSDIYNRGYSA